MQKKVKASIPKVIIQASRSRLILLVKLVNRYYGPKTKPLNIGMLSMKKEIIYLRIYDTS